MIARIIEFSVRNRWLVICAWLGIALWGLYAVVHTPVDAIPDLSENQVIVFTDWMGRSPQDIEEQITYPLSVQLQGLAGVKAVRSSSEFNFSMINIIFDEGTDFYFARTRVLERLGIAQSRLPQGAVPYLAPDATALGQIFWYTVEDSDGATQRRSDEGGKQKAAGRSLDELRAIQDYIVRYRLASVPGVAEVASVGGFVREYQVDVDPQKLRVYDLPLGSVYSAIARSNMSVGGKTLVQNGSEYVVRGVGWLRGIGDLENVIVETRQGVPVRIKELATVQLGPEYRRSAVEKNGREAVGGVVMMRYGENPLSVTQQIKEAIRDVQSGLPQGVRIVPFYDRTRLIEDAIHTVTGTLREEMIIAALAILLILAHFRSALVVCITLPMAVLCAFLLMYYLKIPSNIMSLCGIAISIGILVDAAVVMVENATHELKSHYGQAEVVGNNVEIIIRSTRLVGRPIFFSVLIMLLSFLPVFAFGGQEGKLAHPLAFTKSFAMIGVALLAITFVPALIPLLVRGKLKSEEDSFIVRSFINIYKPTLSWVIDRPALVWWMMAIILALGAGFIASPLLQQIVLGLGALFVLLGHTRHEGTRARRHEVRGKAADRSEAGRIAKVVGLRILALASFLAVAFYADTRFKKLGSEFMPSLNEGSILDMPTSAPRIAMNEAVDDVMLRDRIMSGFPEVESVVGKVGRADTATDPSPVDMVETVVMLTPSDQWPKRMLRYDDLVMQAAVVAQRLADAGLLATGRMQTGDWPRAAKALRDAEFLKYNPRLGAAADLLNIATMSASEQFDRGMRDLARRRQLEYAPEVARRLGEAALDCVLAHVRELPPLKGQPALQHEPSPTQRAELLQKIQPHAELLAQVLRQEEVDKLLLTLQQELAARELVGQRDDLLLDSPRPLAAGLQFVQKAAGLAVPAPAERLFNLLQQRREELWKERTKSFNWELFDYGTDLANRLLVDAILRSSKGTEFEGRHAGGKESDGATERRSDEGKGKAESRKRKAESGDLPATDYAQLTTDFRKKIFFWQKTKDDLLTELDSELQMPGWGNAWTQPILNRVNMLATGVRTQIGVKVFGPSGKPLDQAIADVQQVSQEVAARLKTIRGAVDVVPDQAVGKRYVEIRVDQEKARYYGVNMGELSEAIETAIGGGQVTSTVEGRQRFPVRIRYARDYWQDVDAIGNVLITARATPAVLSSTAGESAKSAAPPAETGAPAGGMGMGSSGSAPAGAKFPAAPIMKPSPAAISPDLPSTVMQIPLSMVADIRIVEGPSMIKSENGRLRNYVTLNVRDRDVVGFVEEARQAVRGIEQKLAGSGMSLEWTGEFEAQLRTWHTLALVAPLVIALILFLLYMTFYSGIDTLLVSLAVLGALSGSLMFQALFGFNFSIIVAIGYVAAFGMATETGVIMLVYLREAIHKFGGLEKVASLQELRSAVITGAVHRLRPKLLTEGVAIVGLVPMLWATGTGAEIMRPMAAPVLGGLLISDEVIDIMIPVLFYWSRRRQWKKLQPV